jgi:hypothetical protein
MRNNKYNFGNKLKKAKKAGRRDGKNEVPKNDWDSNSIPYLQLIHREYCDTKETNILAFKSKVKNMEDEKKSAEQNLISAASNLELAEGRFQEADLNVKQVEAEINGELEDMPSSLPAKRRNLNTFPYSIILIICTIAELLVTIPALQFLLGEKRQFAVLLAFALGTATFFGAHFLGTTLKKRQDRSFPQPAADIALVSVMTSILFLAVVFLAYVRANQTLPVANNFVELPNQWKLEVLWIMWAVWQITFFAIAAVASYKHHSDAVSQLNKAKQARFLRKRQLEKAKTTYFRRKARLDSLETDMTKCLTKTVDEVNQREKLLQAHYRQACALYVDSNIHARRQSIKGDHPAFIAPEFKLSQLSFLAQAPNPETSSWDMSELEQVRGLKK